MNVHRLGCFFKLLAIPLSIFVCVNTQAQAVVTTTADQHFLLQDRLKTVRYSLRVEDGVFTGAGAIVLTEAVAQSRYLLIGEDHLTREIPLFTSALCQVAAPSGLAGMALEVSPDAAESVVSELDRPDRWAKTIALTTKYPASIAFLDSKQENDLIETCAHSAQNPSFHVWGLDQSFLGSANWLIDKMLALQPGPLATEKLESLKQDAEQDAAKASSSGSYGALFLLNPARKQNIQDAAPAIALDGGPQVQRLFHELQASLDIYSIEANGDDDNFERARLLKNNFEKEVQSLPAAASKQKIIVKFGEWHLYKGFNPLHHLDLGNYIAERADLHKEGSLHICILGARGVHRVLGKYAQPSATEKYNLMEDHWYRWTAPAIADQVADGWTLYDLRKLRFQKWAGIDPDFARLIDGYDLLVIIPETTPADMAH